MPESEEFKDAMFRAAVKADGLRAAGLRGLEGVTQARQASLEREQERLSRKLGPEHPRVRALALRREDGTARLRDLKVEIARAETVAPRPSADQWVLHGYVRGKDLNPATDLTVALVDAQGRWLRALGFVCTDARGYFQLVTSMGRAERSAEEPLTPSAVPRELYGYVRITDRGRVQLYRAEEAVLVSPGGVEYREIILEGGTAGCVSPEEGEDYPSAASEKKEPPKPGGRPRRHS